MNTGVLLFKVKALKSNGKCELVVAEYERLMMDNPHIKKIVFGGIWGRYATSSEVNTLDP